MNSLFTPKYIRKIKGVYVLWFEKSNKYIVLNDGNMNIVNAYLNCENEEEFYNTLKNSTNTNLKFLFNEVSQLLYNCNKPNELFTSKKVTLGIFDNWLSHLYTVNDISFEINYSSESVKKLIHPQFQHISKIQSKTSPDTVFHIYLKNNQLHLFTNKVHISSFPKDEYHLLQGKFAMELLCLLTHKKEHDWLGTFHASTVSNNKEAIMLIGGSGQGKSTLSALLMANGFNLIADDFTPVLAKTQTIYNYPSAISIKEGAFKTLESYIKNFNNLETYIANTSKGNIRYLPANNSGSPKDLNCNKIVLVNYEEHADVSIDTLNIEDALNVLIPDSWISPLPEHAKIFMNWLDSCNFYKLTYSKADDAISKFQTLLKPLT
ncbi:hypothetical protein OAD62_06305 [Oceanihabitans sp.]|nr:hypothetical protein [Oceanihabitans sp.]